MNVQTRVDSTARLYAATGPLPPGHPTVKPRRIGVLLTNLGTPDATDYWSMRRYLKEFLWDRRVIEVNRALWWVILNGIILTVRPGRKGDARRDRAPVRKAARDRRLRGRMRR